MSGDRHGLLDGAIAPELNTRLFGHDAAQAFLAAAYRSGKSHHAILVEGPEGIGKSTLAFRFANHVLSHPDPAEAPPVLADPDPNSLVSRQIASGASHNLLYLARPVDEKTGKVKSAITVDEVRKAGHFFGTTSGTGNWRIVIIDPADDLNRNAANAILKLLEEPPRRAMFLVLSHAPGRLLPTIRSRCQTLRLSALDDAAMVGTLAHLGLRLDAEKAADLFALAGGSVAQALKILNYGGLDIISAFNEALREQGPAARQAAHRLADVLSGKDSDVAFGFFIDHLGDHLMAQARRAAHAGSLDEAERLARFSSGIAERLAISTAYNLDRKQTILDLFSDLAEIR